MYVCMYVIELSERENIILRINQDDPCKTFSPTAGVNPCSFSSRLACQAVRLTGRAGAWDHANEGNNGQVPRPKCSQVHKRSISLSFATPALPGETSSFVLYSTPSQNPHQPLSEGTASDNTV